MTNAFRKRQKQIRGSRPPLTVAQILSWADEHHARTGQWPKADGSRVPDLDGCTWRSIDSALRRMNRGLSFRSTLADLLQAERNVRNRKNQPDLSPDQIVRWADAHYLRHGCWPTSRSGAIPEHPMETWSTVDSALIQGRRGLPGRTSLLKLLAEHRGRRNHKALWSLPVESILEWADLHFQKTGAWPTFRSGRIVNAPRETWYAVDSALRFGRRGLAGGSSLIKLLMEKRAVSSPRYQPPLTEVKILEWLDAYRAEHGCWPAETYGPIPNSDGETWAAVAAALRKGYRGLPGGITLPEFIKHHRHPIRSINRPIKDRGCAVLG